MEYKPLLLVEYYQTYHLMSPEMVSNKRISKIKIQNVPSGRHDCILCGLFRLFRAAFFDFLCNKNFNFFKHAEGTLRVVSLRVIVFRKNSKKFQSQQTKNLKSNGCAKIRKASPFLKPMKKMELLSLLPKIRLNWILKTFVLKIQLLISSD